MYDVIIIRFGEIALKGQNRPFFEKKLINHIKKACQKITTVEIIKKRGRIFVYSQENLQDLIEVISKIPGIVSLSPAISVGLDFEKCKKLALKLLKEEIAEHKKDKKQLTFRVSTNRANKAFPSNSMEISRKLGGYLLENFAFLGVNLGNPDLEISLDIRKENIFIFSKTIDGPGGLPVGTSGRALLLLSGGIDSPVAGWLALKRGLKLSAIHFHSPPYTGERATQKVIDLCKILAQTGQEIKLHLVHFTEIQRQIKQKCENKYLITIMRRMMLRITQQIAAREGYQTIITGENIGQVSSQTLENISVISRVIDHLPILRPLITMNKQEIIEIAKNIGTFEVSIQPHEDCCTIFVPDHPATRPKMEKIIYNEKKLAIDQLVKNAVVNTNIHNIEE